MKNCGEFEDDNFNKVYDPVEDVFFGPGDARSFNGFLDLGEDVGVNGLPDELETELGPDGLPGTAGVDDDNNGTIDDASETGACGSDDRLGDNFDPVTCGFGTEGNGFIEGDRGFAPRHTR